MIRLSWRQFRTQAVVASVLLIVAAIALALTGPHLAHLYVGYDKAQAACQASANCRRVNIDVGGLDRMLELLGTALVAVPALLGAFWGAPLIAREFETGTHRLVWTQSNTRSGWLTAKVAVVGTACVAVTGLFSLMVTWWSSPIDHYRMDRFSAGLFGARNLVPLGYAAFGFAVGVVASLLIRRTLPAMAVTLAVFLGVRLAFTQLVRAHLLAPVQLATSLSSRSMGYGSTNNGPGNLMPDPGNLPNAWVYSDRIVNSAGHSLTPQALARICPTLDSALSAPPPASVSGATTPQRAPAGVEDALHTCVAKVGATYHQLVTYQPAGRYWDLQVYETGIFLAAACALIGLCYWLIRR
jgi:hypothetical protein